VGSKKTGERWNGNGNDDVSMFFGRGKMKVWEREMSELATAIYNTNM
jgi:hypothetical protein